MPIRALEALRPALVLVTVASGVACGRRPTPPDPIAATSPPARLAPGHPTPPAAAITLLRTALERSDTRLRVRLPRDGAIAVQPGPTDGTWTFRCRCYAYVPASTLPWVFEATGTVDVPAGRVSLASLTPPPELPRHLLPSPVAVHPPDLRTTSAFTDP